MKQRGFTLIELMVVVAIVAILASIAIPAYSEFVERSRRGDAKTGLVGAQQGLERCFTRFGTYNNASCNIATDLGGGYDSENAYYLISGNVLATSYTLQAVPVGNQTGDTDCLTFGLSNTGVRTITGDKDVDYCWNR
ncbi:MAG: type IV pilin protein [Xanthomonadales bacterium]|nr:type IV pilin protein [Xanthomonadales bacterium]